LPISTPFIMRGLDPRIRFVATKEDDRVTPGHDEEGGEG